MASLWDLLPATPPGQPFAPVMPDPDQVDPWLRFLPAASQAGAGGNVAPPSAASANQLGGVLGTAVAMRPPAGVLQLPPATPRAQPFLPPGVTSDQVDPWLRPVFPPVTPQADTSSSAAPPILASANQLGGVLGTGAALRPPASFWSLLPATPHGQPFLPPGVTMDQVDPWLPPLFTPVTPQPGASSNAAPFMPPPSMPASGADDANAPPSTSAGQQRDFGAAYGNSYIARQGARARAIAAMRPPPPPAIADIWPEIGGAAADAMHNINAGLNPFSAETRAGRDAEAKATTPADALAAYWENEKRVGRGLLGIPQLALSPLTGASRSLAGHGLQWFDANVLRNLAIATFGEEKIRQIEQARGSSGGLSYDEAKGAVDQIMMGLGPRGGMPSVPLAPAPRAFPAPAVEPLPVRPAESVVGPGATKSTPETPILPPVEPTLTGQEHHAISKKIHNELEKAPGLAGFYRYRDPRFVAKAIDLPAHNGYDEWHRAYDAEIAAYIKAHPELTPETFENWLRARYAKPDLKVRFPKGF